MSSKEDGQGPDRILLCSDDFLAVAVKNTDVRGKGWGLGEGFGDANGNGFGWGYGKGVGWIDGDKW